LSLQNDKDKGMHLNREDGPGRQDEDGSEVHFLIRIVRSEIAFYLFERINPRETIYLLMIPYMANG